ncbi:MAG: undecaprenyl-diphosphate phosphatase [Gammaproteobacteria bacterium]|jgi:undecaprenyl-diphosphatase
MEDILDSILLGIVQGLTEFLPVSSSGHLVLAQELLDAHLGQGILFEVAVHIATLFAILIFYRRRVTELAQGVFSFKKPALEYVGKLVVGTLPAIIVALLFRTWIEAQFDSLLGVGICLILTGFIVFSTRFTNKHTGLDEPTWTAALLIGCVQAFAILPGISRSGSTVAAGLALGLSPLAAAEFSFMLGMIAMAGAGVLMLPELSSVETGLMNTILFGALASLISGLLALAAFVWLLRTQRFFIFAWYAWLVGGITVAWALA